MAGSQSFPQHHQSVENKLSISSRFELCDSVVRVTCLHGGVDFAHGHTHHLQTRRETPVRVLSAPVAWVCGPLSWGGQAKFVSTFQCLTLTHSTSGHLITRDP